jgi:phosphatidylglycerophosphate synthase
MAHHEAEWRIADGEATESRLLPPPQRLFPLVRQLSHRLTPLLLRTPMTPNQITVAGTLVGLLGVCLLRFPGRAAGAAGCALFILCQVLDSCDGEVARIKRLGSSFGRRLDDFGDFLVHSSLFVVLGARAADIYAHSVWLWLGGATAFGVLMEWVLSLVRRPESLPVAAETDAAATVSPFDETEGVSRVDKAVYVFRVLLDADYCFILPLFVVGDLLWLLLPFAAVGNQLYWASAFYGNARRYHG